MTALVEGESVLLGGIAGRYPYDSNASNVVWPVTIAKHKLHQQIGHNAEDLLLNDEFGGYLAAATEEVESRGDIALIYQKRRLILDRLPSSEAIAIPRSPLVQVDAVTYLDADESEQTLAASNYRVSSKGGVGSIYFKDASAVVADGPSVLWVDMVCGFGQAVADVPAQWRQIVMAIASHLYERREMVAGGGLDDAFERVIDRKIRAAGTNNNRYA